MAGRCLREWGGEIPVDELEELTAGEIDRVAEGINLLRPGMEGRRC